MWATNDKNLFGLVSAVESLQGVGGDFASDFFMSDVKDLETKYPPATLERVRECLAKPLGRARQGDQVALQHATASSTTP